MFWILQVNERKSRNYNEKPHQELKTNQKTLDIKFYKIQ